MPAELGLLQLQNLILKALVPLHQYTALQEQMEGCRWEARLLPLSRPPSRSGTTLLVLVCDSSRGRSCQWLAGGPNKHSLVLLAPASVRL